MVTPHFESLPFSSSQTVSWIHIGDLHMTRAGEQNEIDLGRIVDEINSIYGKGGLDFVFIPGDIADDGSVVAYEAVRHHLDRLEVPWCGIVGDHDVHEKSYDNFQKYIAKDLYSRFVVGPYRFLRLNAFGEPRPDSFLLGDDQLKWLERELNECVAQSQRAVLLLHCYPTDLKHGAEALAKLIRSYPVLLVDMGHTHYNEVSNDGHALYSATRSTGQIEEGPVGYSVTTIDHDVVSWHFKELGSKGHAAITMPHDERLMTHREQATGLASPATVRVKVWSASGGARIASAQVDGLHVALRAVDDHLWEGTLDTKSLRQGVHELNATVEAADGAILSDQIRICVGELPQRDFDERDQENALGEWRERGLLGTQLGPNKNGKKW